jgi:hypothetical protein
LKGIEEGQDELGGNMLQSERSDLDTVMICGKGKQELKGIPIGPDGIGADPLDVDKIMIEELMNNGGEFHCFVFCQREKSTRF